MRVFERILADPDACGYLPDRTARLEFHLAVDVAPATLDRLLERGWRRFGYAYFRPACPACRACVSIRVPVDRFRPNRAQARAARAGADLTWTFDVPVVDAARLRLLARWHRERERSRGWKPQFMSAARYEIEFAAPQDCARELAGWDASGRRRPVVVMLADETPRAMSAVYTYFDPADARRSPGTLAILKLIDLARERGKRWVYLGYRVLGCPSSEYKARFRPHEIAHGWPDLDRPAPDWIPVSAPGRSAP